MQSESVREEIRAAIAADDSALGDVYRRTQAGETSEQIMQARGAATAGFVWSYLRICRAAIDGDLPTAPTVATNVARSIRRLLKLNSFSGAAQSVLEERVAELQRRSSDPDEVEREEREAKLATASAEQTATPGIYVYSLPHYVRYPFDPESGRTLLKVGHANRSVIERFRNQTRTTALPEDPVLLRIYPATEGRSKELERTFHQLLEAADHDRSKARTGGTEWFLTSTKFVDAVARTLGLEVREVAPLAEPDTTT